jgi:SAP domain-containing protein
VIEVETWGIEFLSPKTKLSASMTLAQFDNGYWYATELKSFAKSIGIPFTNGLRKDELEDRIKRFLKTGKVDVTEERVSSIVKTKDVALGLSLDLAVTTYTNDKETKTFLETEAQRMVAGLKRKSGARYRLNRWREEQIIKGIKITYGDVVREYVRLNQIEGRFAQIPLDRYINFLSDFLRAEKGSTRKQGIQAWKKLKTLDVPKNYRSWKRFQSGKK